MQEQLLETRLIMSFRYDIARWLTAVRGDVKCIEKLAIARQLQACRVDVSGCRFLQVRGLLEAGIRLQEKLTRTACNAWQEQSKYDIKAAEANRSKAN